MAKVWMTLVLLGVSALPAVAFEPIFSRQYIRAHGKPATTSESFTVCDPAGQFRLVVNNGPTGTKRVSSGTLSVNGIEIVHPSDFNQTVQRIERPLANLASENRIDVRLASGPGATIELVVEGIQRCHSILIQSPAAGATIHGPVVLVKGEIVGSLGDDLGITVNEFPALTDGARSRPWYSFRLR